MKPQFPIWDETARSRDAVFGIPGTIRPQNPDRPPEFRTGVRNPGSCGLEILFAVKLDSIPAFCSGKRIELNTPPAAHQAEHKGKNQPDDKQNPGDVNGGSGDSTETQHTGNECNNQECGSPSEHDVLLLYKN